MSPSSDSHSSPHSNTPSPLSTLRTGDTLPISSTSLGINSSFFASMPTTPQPPAFWSPLVLSRSLPASRAAERTAPANLAVPAHTFGHIGSSFDLSPSPPIHGSIDEQSTHAAFLLTRSRAVKVRKDPSTTFLSLCSIFDFLGGNNQADHSSVASTPTMWTLKDLSALDQVWIVFKTHRDACIFLSLSLPSFTIHPALETDLEPFEKLRRVDLSSRFPPLPVIQPERKTQRLRMSLSTPDLHNHIYAGQPGIDNHPLSALSDKFVISTNPPNPRTTFRVGDWICSSVTCAAHNFGRNLACRGCGCPRSESQVLPSNRHALGMPSARLPTSPRFASNGGVSTPASSHYPAMQHDARYPLAAQPIAGPKPASLSHPLLTPSGRDFSVGGKVQNISSDPSVPCIMYWPDNEPFPDQGQIRPCNLSGIPQPPILNTGNRGPIEHQPGDWICQKCNYLNWRRRKVCQTCYPYAEGNGDSISAAVQSERINLLTSLLAQNQLPFRTTPPSADVPRRNTVTQMQHLRPLESFAPPSRSSSSQVDVRTTPQCPEPQFIYETSGPHRHALPLFPGMRDLEDTLPAAAPAPLLPSFLQDIVQSPTLSPTSTSSADLSVDEYDDITPSRPNRDRVTARDECAANFHFGNIWRLNDEETTSVAGVALPYHNDFVGSKKNSQEILRRQSP